ncbi:hypothetical protein N9A94_04550 [Akkermansiaceae bacterium]|nr:hypothetical protein [Akkermansiaceae bacterium]MDA7888357.1 hypothetical protein [Akkermansiaceae bacterium]
MTSSQKIGKAAWISFLIASAPLAILIVVVFIGTIFLSRENVGPLEDEPTPLIERALILISVITFPIVWFLGLIIAHRFNGVRARLIPFLANLFPVIGLTFFAAELVRDEGSDFVWMIYYICFLILTLAIGIVAAIASICDKPKPESEGCSQ